MFEYTGMNYPSIMRVLFFFLQLAAFCSCNPFSKSWQTIYDEQQRLFRANRGTFNQAADIINSSRYQDSTLPVSDKYFQFPDTLLVKLKDLGISTITFYNKNCITKDIRFTPDSLWDADRFTVMEIRFDKCDERSKHGYHWIMEGSDHKHAFGQGDGWFLYSDTDRDPF
jgi:hypothetical protein